MIVNLSYFSISYFTIANAIFNPGIDSRLLLFSLYFFRVSISISESNFLYGSKMHKFYWFFIFLFKIFLIDLIFLILLDNIEDFKD